MKSGGTVDEGKKVGKRVKKFPVSLFVDQEEGESNSRRLEVELFDRQGGALVSREIVEGSLRIAPCVEPFDGDGKEGEKASPGQNCIAVSETTYADGKARFRIQVKEEFINDPDFLRKIPGPILYTIEAKPRPGKGQNTDLEPITHVLDFRILVASIHWKWWAIAPGNVPAEAPLDAEEDTSIRLDPDGAGGFRLELSVKEFNPLTGRFESGEDDYDFVHDLGHEGGKITKAELAASPEPWNSEDLQQRYSNWFSRRDLIPAGAEFELPCEDALKVTAFPEKSIVRRFAEAPYAEAGLPKVATRRIAVRLERFDFELWRIDGEEPKGKLPLSAAAESIPPGGYQLTLKIFNDGEAAEGVRVKAGLWKEGGREPFGEIVGGASEELMTAADGTVDFYYKPRAISLRPEDFRREVLFEERFEVLARRSERCRPYRLSERGVPATGGAGRNHPSLSLALEPELKLKFFKKPFLFNDPKGEKAPVRKVPGEGGETGEEAGAEAPEEAVSEGLEPFEIDLGKEMEAGDRKRLGEIIERGGELHLKAILKRGQSTERVKIRDGSWCSGEQSGEGEGLDKWDTWLDSEEKEVCVLKFPVTGRQGGAVAEPLEFEAKFGVIVPIGSQLERIEDRAGAVDEILGTNTLRKKARRFVERCLERIAVESEESLDGETESIFETIAAISCFLWSTKLSKEAMEVSFDLQAKAFRRVRENFIEAFGEILTFRPVSAGLPEDEATPEEKIEETPKEANEENPGEAAGEGREEAAEEKRGGRPAKAEVLSLIREYLAEGPAGARRVARRLARQIPRESCGVAEKLLRETLEGIVKEAATCREESESARQALKASTTSLVELARKIVPLNQAQSLQKRSLKMLKDELPGFVAAADSAKEDLLVITGRIENLRKMVADCGGRRNAEIAKLEDLRKTAKNHADEEAEAFAESENLAEELKEKTKETQAAQAMRDSAKEKLEGFTWEQEDLEAARLEAETKSAACQAEVERLKSAITNSKRAREAAIGRQDGLEKKLGDRRGATVSAEKEIRSTDEEVKRIAELIREKKAGREDLLEKLARFAKDLDSRREAELEAREVLDRETKVIDELKGESPPNAAKIREAEKARVAASRKHETAEERLSEQALRVERAEGAVRDSERTIEELRGKERNAQRLADDRKDALQRARQLEKEQTEMVASNSREIERLKEELISLEGDLEVAGKAQVEAAETLAGVAEAVSSNEEQLEETRKEFDLTNKIYTEFEAARATLEEYYGEAVARLKSAKGRVESSRESVSASEERLAGLKEESEEFEEKDEREVLQEAEATQRSVAAAERLKEHEEEISETELALEETEKELSPLARKLSETREEWKEARAAEAEVYRKHAEKSLEERNLSDWARKLEELKKESCAIAHEEREEVAHQLWALADCIPEGEKRPGTIGNHVDEVVHRRAVELREWVGILEALPAESGEVIGRDELLASWEDYQNLGGAATKDRLAEGVEALWNTLEQRVSEALPAADPEMTGTIGKLKSVPPPGSLEMDGEGVKSWARRVEEIDGTADWIERMQKRTRGPLSAWIPDAVERYYSDWVYHAFVEGLCWIQLVMVNVARKASELFSEIGSLEVSVLTEGHRGSARGFIDKKSLCAEDFFKFVPKAELTLAERLSPDKLLERVGSEKEFAEFQKALEEETARGYESRFGAQRLRAGGAYESLCLEALDPARIENLAPMESLRQRRKVIALQEAVTKRMGEFWEALEALENEKEASGTELAALGARSPLRSTAWGALLDWVGWALTWNVRCGAIVSSIAGLDPGRRKRYSTEAVEEVRRKLRLGFAAALTYPEVLAFQRDLLLVESLAFQALFEKYQLPEVKSLIQEVRSPEEEKLPIDHE